MLELRQKVRWRAVYEAHLAEVIEVRLDQSEPEYMIEFIELPHGYRPAEGRRAIQGPLQEEQLEVVG